MPVISRLNKSTLSQKQKRQVRKGLRESALTAVLPTTYTHTQSNTTLASISNFSVPVVKDTTYVFDICLIGVANASGGIKFGVTAPTATFCVGQVMLDNGTTFASTVATNLAGVAGGSTAVAVEIFATGTYRASADGRFQIQAAQNASNASNSTILAGSYLRLTEVVAA